MEDTSMLPRLIVAALVAALAGISIASEPPTIVKTRSLAEVLIERKFTAPATAVAINSSEISAEISARIIAIQARVGDTVEANDILARLDCRSYENALSGVSAELKSLDAQRQFAEQQLKRAKSLREKNNLSAEIYDRRVADLDAILASYEAQEARLADAQLAVDRCTITAPYRAAVTARLAGEGAMATPGQPLMSLIGLDAVELSAQVPLSLTELLRQSSSLELIIDDTAMAVSVRKLSPVIDAETGTREVRLTTENALTPGASGRLEWYSTDLLPASLLSRREGTLGVLIADTGSGDAVAKFLAIPGSLEGRPARVNLPADTVVIVEGRHTLSPGDAIVIESGND